MEFDTRAVIKSSVKGFLASCPGLASWVQVWDEHESEEMKRRIDRFWEAFKFEVERNDSRFKELRDKISTIMDSLDVLESAVHVARHETSDKKVQALVHITVNAILSELPRDHKLNLIESIESLNEGDLNILSLFDNGRTWKVENLPGAMDRSKMGDLIASISKLESRGLIGQTSSKSSVTSDSWWGDANDWYNQWKRRYYEALPFGNILLRLAK